MLVENSVTKIPTERKTISWKSLAIASIVVLVVIAGGRIIISNSETTVTPTSLSSPTPSTTPSSAPSVEASPSQSSEVVTSASGKLSLTISATRGNSNIDVVVGGKNLYKGPLFQGESKSFSAPNSISVYLSNAGDLDLTLNGEEIAPLGARNQEIRKTFRSK
jgi:hypothetical protein